LVEDCGASWLAVAKIIFENYGLKINELTLTQITALLELTGKNMQRKPQGKTMSATKANLAAFGFKMD
jgi:hypothetical protein